MGKRIRAFIFLGLNGCKIDEDLELPEGWDEWPEGDREEYLNQTASEHLGNNCDYGAYVVDDE